MELSSHLYSVEGRTLILRSSCMPSGKFLESCFDCFKTRISCPRFCFQIPLIEYGERLMEKGMEDILKKKHQVFGNGG